MPAPRCSTTGCWPPSSATSAAGGTFVAVNNTGRHALLQADAWPIARLTGFNVSGAREGSGDGARSDWLPQLAGRTFDNSDGICPATEPAPPTRPSWPAGTMRAVAAAVRQLGKGRIVVLGATSGGTVGSAGRRAAAGQQRETAFFTDLFGRLGIAKPADVDSEDVWVRRFRTKNGLQQWVMAYNSGRAALAGLTLSFPLESRPRCLLDAVSGKAVEFTWAGGTLRVANLDIEANSMRVFAVDSDDVLGRGRALVRREAAIRVASGRSAGPRAVAQPAGHGDRDGRFSLPPASIHRGTGIRGVELAQPNRPRGRPVRCRLWLLG